MILTQSVFSVLTALEMKNDERMNFYYKLKVKVCHMFSCSADSFFTNLLEFTSLVIYQHFCCNPARATDDISIRLRKLFTHSPQYTRT